MNVTSLDLVSQLDNLDFLSHLENNVSTRNDN